MHKGEEGFLSDPVLFHLLRPLLFLPLFLGSCLEGKAANPIYRLEETPIVQLQGLPLNLSFFLQQLGRLARLIKRN